MARLRKDPKPRALVVSSGLAFSCRMLGEEIASVFSPGGNDASGQCHERSQLFGPTCQGDVVNKFVMPVMGDNFSANISIGL